MKHSDAYSAAQLEINAQYTANVPQKKISKSKLLADGSKWILIPAYAKNITGAYRSNFSENKENENYYLNN